MKFLMNIFSGLLNSTSETILHPPHASQQGIYLLKTG
jgi:hypothetical protein